MENNTLVNQLKQFNFDSINYSNLLETQKNLLKAVQSIYQCDDQTSTDLLRDLYLNNSSEAIKNTAAKLLFQQLFWQDQFEQIDLLGLNESNAIDSSYQTISKRLVDPSKKKHFFTSDRSINNLRPSITGSPMINVLINGVNKSFWLDTGALISVVSAETADLCQMTLDTNQIALETSTDQEMNSQIGEIKDLVISNLVLKNISTVVLPTEVLTIADPALPETIKIDGIIGWDLIKYMDLTIDYKNKTLAISKPIKKEISNKNIIMDGYVLIKAEALNQEGLIFGLDTGANKSNFSPNLVDKLKISDLKSKSNTIAGVGGLKEVHQEIMPELDLKINNHLLKLKDLNSLVYSPSDFFQVDGILASDVAQNGVLHIDYTNRLFEIE